MSLKHAIHDIPVDLIVDFGTLQSTLSALSTLKAQSILTMEDKADAPITLRLGDQVIAHGELKHNEETGDIAIQITSTQTEVPE